MKKTWEYFSNLEKTLWLLSVITILLSFIFYKSNEYLYLIGSLIGVTALIFTAKGHVVGQVLIVVFSIFYGIISYSFAYYGEMITYLGMTTPIAIASIVTWLKNPAEGKNNEVQVNSIKLTEYILMLLGGIAVTVAFYFILSAMNTESLIISTLSVLTSFVASYLTMRRSKFYALAYALNDIVLITLWVIASQVNHSYVPIVICFIAFF
ncbi:MAG TPA: nicotinamide riboside transporter PnuC, partial [Bacilli bacterium]|nr:nicotinamide riboside transporter PnuC [Bacilli bacterium]